MIKGQQNFSFFTVSKKKKALQFLITIFLSEERMLTAVLIPHSPH